MLNLTIINIIKRFTFALLILFNVNADAQLVGKLEQQIFDNVKGYDSALLTYQLSGMGYYAELTIEGYGMKNNKVSKLSIVFSDKGESYGDNRTAFKKMSVKVINRSDISDSVKNMCFSCIAPLSDTAIVWCIDENTGELSYVSVHDASTRVIYTIKGTQYFYKYGSVAAMYQNRCPTKDRGTFIAIRDHLLNTLEKHHQ